MNRLVASALLVLIASMNPAAHGTGLPINVKKKAVVVRALCNKTGVLISVVMPELGGVTTAQTFCARSQKPAGTFYKEGSIVEVIYTKNGYFEVVGKASAEPSQASEPPTQEVGTKL